MGKNRKNKHSDFAERIREWEEKNPDEVARRNRHEAFMEATRPFLRLYRSPHVGKVGDGFQGGFRDRFETLLLTDAFGGDLYCIHLAANGTTRSRISNHIASCFKSEADQKAVRELLPQAREEFERRLSDKISQAVDDLALEVLWPLYQATNKKYRSRIIHYDPYDPDNPDLERYEIAELKGGHIVRHTVKQLKPGGKEKITDKKLEEAYRRLGKQASQQKVADYLGVSVRGLQLWAKTQKAESWREVANYYKQKIADESRKAK